MAEVLVVAEHAGGELRKITLEMLTLARDLGRPAPVVLGTPGAAAAFAGTLAAYGAARVYAAESEEIDDHLVAPKAAVLADLVRTVRPAAVLLAGTQEGKEIAGRLAVKLDNGLLVDVSTLEPDGTATQVVFAGGTVVTSRVTRGLPLATLRPNAVTPSVVGPAQDETPQDEAEVVPVEVTVPESARLARVVRRVAEPRGERPDLADAPVVVSGGRGVGSAEGFALVEELADLLGGAVGASRAAIDAGFYPHQYQVGQTGRTVSPQLYVALGISGAIQHRAGMQTSRTVVVVDKDPDAPFFALADFGVVGDVREVLPQVIEALRNRR